MQQALLPTLSQARYHLPRALEIPDQRLRRGCPSSPLLGPLARAGPRTVSFLFSTAC